MDAAPECATGDLRAIYGQISFTETLSGIEIIVYCMYLYKVSSNSAPTALNEPKQIGKKGVQVLHGCQSNLSAVEPSNGLLQIQCTVNGPAWCPIVDIN